MPELTGSAAVLTVGDLAASMKHYRDVLGFSVTFEYGEPLSYVCLCREDVQLHLASAALTKHASGNGDVAVFVTGVDAIHAELAVRGANILAPPQNRDYGMRDFSVVDPDANRLTFGEPVA
jgi:uncharacterized glyoxalase superfamily protein PhnB